MSDKCPECGMTIIDHIAGGPDHHPREFIGAFFCMRKQRDNLQAKYDALVERADDMESDAFQRGVDAAQEN
jgi:hypothetical protein